MTPRPTIRRTVLFFALLLLAVGAANAEEKWNEIDIDGEKWTFVRQASHCETRIEAAIKAYWDAPLYASWRKPNFDRFYVNESRDCWVQLYIDGVSETSAAFRISQQNKVLDRRLYTNWQPHIRPYPNGLIHPN